MYKACIFDLDGTLADTLESLSYSVNRTLRELKLPEITNKQCKSFVGEGARRLMERSLEAAGDTDMSLLERAMEIYGRIFKANCTYHVTPYDGISDMLWELKKQGIKLGVLSNKPHLQTVDVVAECFKADTFVCVQGQKEGVPRKPNPTAALLIAEALQLDGKECLYIGDSDVDMQTGNAAGMECVGVTWGFRSKQILVENGAKYIIDTPHELVEIVKTRG